LPPTTPDPDGGCDWAIIVLQFDLDNM